MATDRQTCSCPDRRCQWYAERERWEPVGWVYHAIGQNMPTMCPPHCPWCGDALTPGVAVPRPAANTPDGARVLARYMRALGMACATLTLLKLRLPRWDRATDESEKLAEGYLQHASICQSEADALDALEAERAALAEPPEGEA